MSHAAGSQLASDRPLRSAMSPSPEAMVRDSTCGSPCALVRLRLRALEELLKCSLCHALPTAPVALSVCGHIFCSLCVRLHLTLKSQCPEPACLTSATTSSILPLPALSCRSLPAEGADDAASQPAGLRVVQNHEPRLPFLLDASVQILQKKLADAGLKKTGDLSALRARYRHYVIVYNAALDGGEVGEERRKNIANRVQDWEAGLVSGEKKKRSREYKAFFKGGGVPKRMRVVGGAELTREGGVDAENCAQAGDNFEVLLGKMWARVEAQTGVCTKRGQKLQAWNAFNKRYGRVGEIDAGADEIMAVADSDEQHPEGRGNAKLGSKTVDIVDNIIGGENADVVDLVEEDDDDDDDFSIPHPGSPPIHPPAVLTAGEAEFIPESPAVRPAKSNCKAERTNADRNVIDFLRADYATSDEAEVGASAMVDNEDSEEDSQMAARPAVSSAQPITPSRDSALPGNLLRRPRRSSGTLHEQVHLSVMTNRKAIVMPTKQSGTDPPTQTATVRVSPRTCVALRGSDSLTGGITSRIGDRAAPQASSVGCGFGRNRNLPEECTITRNLHLESQSREKPRNVFRGDSTSLAHETHPKPTKPSFDASPAEANVQFPHSSILSSARNLEASTPRKLATPEEIEEKRQLAIARREMVPKRNLPEEYTVARSLSLESQSHKRREDVFNRDITPLAHGTCPKPTKSSLDASPREANVQFPPPYVLNSARNLEASSHRKLTTPEGIEERRQMAIARRDLGSNRNVPEECTVTRRLNLESQSGKKQGNICSGVIIPLTHGVHLKPTKAPFDASPADANEPHRPSNILSSDRNLQSSPPRKLATPEEIEEKRRMAIARQRQKKLMEAAVGDDERSQRAVAHQKQKVQVQHVYRRT